MAGSSIQPVVTPTDDRVARQDVAARRLSPAATLLLLRLAVVPDGGKPPKTADLRKDLGKLLPAPPNESAMAEARDELTAAGLAEPIAAPPEPAAAPAPPAPAGSEPTKRPKKARAAKVPKADPDARRLTAAGRARAAALLGLDAAPAKTTWSDLVKKYLFPAAAGLPAGGKLPPAGQLTAHLVRRRHGLPAGPAADAVGKALDALACRELGFPAAADWAALRAAVLNRAFSRLRGQPVELTSKQVDKQVPVLLLDAAGTSPEAVKLATIRRWLESERTDSPPTAVTPTSTSPSDPSPAGGTDDLSAFAAAAKRAAADSPTGRFGANKVFIAHAWRRFQTDRPDGSVGDGGPPRSPTDLPAFKARLIEANRARLLTLARADLVEAMDPADVRESQARYLNAEFHFILIEGSQP